jgi:hypothetical protein
MSIQANFPAIKPTLLLDFANVEQLDPRVTFARASTATYYGTQTAKAEENLLLQSQDFTTSWSNVATSDTADTTVAPDGTTTADTITATGTGAHYVQQTSLSTAGTQRVLSCFVKAGTNNYVQLGFGTSVTAYVNFDVTSGAGAVGTVGATATASIVDAGNGWFRCIVITSDATASALCFIAIIQTSTDARLRSFVAAGTETIILWGAQLEQRSAATAYTATTTQPITNYIPQLLTAASGVARFDHNPTTFESLGLLIEESRTNLLTYSSEISNAAWTKNQVVVTENSLTAPDGTVSADTIAEDTTTNFHRVISPTFSVTSGTAYTFSVYAKKGTNNFVQLFVSTGFDSVNAFANFNIDVGTVGTVGSAATSTIANVGNGWYRCTMTTTSSATSAVAIINYGLVTSSTAARAESYLGTGKTVFVWGGQVEAGAFATSVIPTTTTALTRAADVATMTGANFSNWYNQTEGTLFNEYINYTTATGSLFSTDDATVNNRIITLTSGGTNAAVRVIAGGVDQVSANVASVTAGSVARLAFGYKLNDFAASVNGAAVVTYTSGTVPTGQTTARIGSNVVSAAFLNGHLRRITYYPRRLTNSELQALTA